MGLKTGDAGKSEWTKIRAVVCAMIANLMIGAYYFYSNINSYVAAYLASFDDSVTPKDTLLIMPVWIVCQSLGTIASIKLCALFGFPAVSNLAYACFALCSLAMVFVKNYWMFVFIYGVLAGLSIGLGYMPSLFIAWTYYPNKKSIVTGVALFTAGISASILSPFSTAIVNPNNQKDYQTDPRVFGRVPFLFFCLFLCFGGLAAVLSILQPPPHQSEEVEDIIEVKHAAEEIAKADHCSLEMYELHHQSQFGTPQKPPSPNRTSHYGMTREDWVTENDLKYVVNRELEEDTQGFIPPQEMFAMAVLPSEQLVNIVGHKKSLQLMLNERKESLRMSLRAFHCKDSKLGSMLVLDQDQKNTLQVPGDARSTEKQGKASLSFRIQEHLRARASVNKMLEEIHSDCPSLVQALRSRAFVWLCLMAYSCSIYNYFMNSVWKQFYVTKIEVSDKQMALILSYGAFANSCLRVAAGFLMMKYEFKTIFLILIGSTIFCCFTIDSLLVNYAIGAFFSMTVFGGIGVQVTIFPTVCTKVFGPLVGPKVFPFVFSCFSLANLTQYFLLKFTDNWRLLFWLFGFIAIGGLLVGLSFSTEHKWPIDSSHRETEGTEGVAGLTGQKDEKKDKLLEH